MHINQILTKKQQDLLIKRVRSKIGTAIKKYQLIEKDDKIIVGLSGGKDSFILLESLVYFKQKAPLKFDLHAVHINIENIPYETNSDYLKEFCSELDVPLYVRNITFDPKSESEKSVCFQCSWNRRKELFAIAKELNCSKMALGHHKDDIVETLLMNMCFQGTISTMPPKMSMSKWAFHIIRPLAIVAEAEIKQIFDIRNYKKQKKLCPYENKTMRNTIRMALNDLEKIQPNVRNNIFKSMGNVMDEYLP